MIASDNELVALLLTKKMIKSGSPDMDQFIQWLAERLEHVYKEGPNIDFVQATYRYAKLLKEIKELICQ